MYDTNDYQLSPSQEFKDIEDFSKIFAITLICSSQVSANHDSIWRRGHPTRPKRTATHQSTGPWWPARSDWEDPRIRICTFGFSYYPGLLELSRRAPTIPLVNGLVTPSHQAWQAMQ